MCGLLINVFSLMSSLLLNKSTISRFFKLDSIVLSYPAILLFVILVVYSILLCPSALGSNTSLPILVPDNTTFPLLLTSFNIGK